MYKLNETSFRNETHLISTVTITDTDPKDTGFYKCQGVWKKERYVYVSSRSFILSFSQTIQKYWTNCHFATRTHSGHEKLVFLEFEYYLTIDSTNTKEGDSIVIPLKVTHPNVNVSIYRRKDEDEGEGVDYQKVILKQWFEFRFDF